MTPAADVFHCPMRTARPGLGGDRHRPHHKGIRWQPRPVPTVTGGSLSEWGTLVSAPFCKERTARQRHPPPGMWLRLEFHSARYGRHYSLAQLPLQKVTIRRAPVECRNDRRQFTRNGPWHRATHGPSLSLASRHTRALAGDPSHDRGPVQPIGEAGRSTRLSQCRVPCSRAQ